MPNAVMTDAIELDIDPQSNSRLEREVVQPRTMALTSMLARLGVSNGAEGSTNAECGHTAHVSKDSF